MYDLYFGIYLQMLNILHPVQNSGYWYCFCDKFDGCSVGWFSPAKICSTICQIAYDFGMDIFEKNKYDPKKLLSFASDLIKELKVAVSHDENVCSLWCHEYKFKWCDCQAGTKVGMHLFNFIDF